MAKTKVDFSGVDPEIRSGGRGVRLPEDDYLFKIVKGEKRKSEKSQAYYFNWQLTVAKGEFKGKSVYMNTSLKPDALWNLRNLIHAATGKNVAGKSVAFDPAIIEGKIIAGTVVDGEPFGDEGKIKSEVVDVRPKDELEADDDDEEEEVATESETEEEEEESEEELEDVDLDEL